MRAVIFDQPGDASVLRLVDRPVPEPGAGEVRVRIAYSGVNPTDWKNRRSASPGEEVVANQDGSGIVDAVGPGVTGFQAGDRVWLTAAAYQRPAGGTAQEYTVIPVERVFPLPAEASLELGASIGIPALTAHEALVSGQGVADRLAPGALAGKVVLVAGGAGAVGNAAIQLARWAGARVATTVSSAAKAELATAAGAHLVVDYRTEDVADRVRDFAPDGVDIIVEVAPVANAAVDQAVIGHRGTIASYAADGDGDLTIPVRPQMVRNGRFQFVLMYTIGWDAIGRGAESVNAAVAAGALRIGPEAGIPLHQYPLEETDKAHRAVEEGAVGKVLISVG